MDTLSNITVPEEYDLERIDTFLASAMELDFSRSYIQKLIKGKNILVNGNAIKSNYKVKSEDSISITLPEPKKVEIFPEDIPLEILYEDEHICVINKQPGLVVHIGPGNYTKTLVNALLYHVKKLSDAGDDFRPGIVHRLDRDTAGIMVIAKDNEAYHGLVKAFSSRDVTKKYAAIVSGKPGEENGIIDQPIGRHKKYRHKMTLCEDGKEAITQYEVEKIWHLKMGEVFTLLDIQIHTGRTHQIRVHLSSMGHPVIGDRIYSKKWQKYKIPYLLLCAKELAFIHPCTGEEMKFSVELPQHFKDYMTKLDKKTG